MKIPVQWLKDYVDINIDSKELADRLLFLALTWKK